MAKRLTITEQFLRAIRRAEKRGISRYRMAWLSGISQAHLSRFVNGKRTLTIETADTLARAIGYRVLLTNVHKRNQKITPK